MTSPHMSGPLFSVVVRTYDRPALLPQTIASILAQTVSDFEVVIVDDAGSVPPPPVDDPRVRVIRREHNGGPAAALNTGAAAACGRYLTFLDDDDLWTANRLELALQGLARAPVALCWSRYIDEIPSPKRVLDGWVGDTILDQVTPSLITTAIDRDAFIPLDPRYRGTEDVAWWLLVAQEHEVATVPRFGALVRRHPEVRATHGDAARIEGGLRLLDEHQLWFSTHRRARAMRWQRIGLTAARSGSIGTARRAYARSLWARPRLAPVVHLARTLVPAPTAPSPEPAAPAGDPRPPGAQRRASSGGTRPSATTDAAKRGRPLRILQVITDDDRRGAQVFARDLEEALRVLGQTVDTVALAPGRAGGLDVETLGASRLGLPTLRELRRRVRGADVVVAHGSSTLPACAVATAGTGVPFVYRQISESLFWADTARKRQRVRLLLARAAAVVSLASGPAAVLHDRFGVPWAQLRVIPNGVPASDFAPATPAIRAAARESFGLRPDRPVVLSISALVPEKGVDVVIDAVAELDGVQLLVAGAGPARAGLERAARIRVGERAVFAGSVAHPAEAYAAADVVVLASKGGDSMPATLVEAGFCALPVVTTAIGAIADIVVDGDTGVVLPSAEPDRVRAAIASLLDDPASAAACGAAARRRCLEQFEISVVAEAWLDVLRHVRESV